VNRKSYLLGDCAALALAINSITGWPLIVITSPCHAMTRMPDGRLLDAAGPHPPDCLDGFSWQETDEQELAARFGLTGVSAEVMADARELLEHLSDMPAGAFPWRTRSGRVTAGDLASSALIPAG
jgi:hypothetical protein